MHRGIRLQMELLGGWLRSSAVRFRVALIFPVVLSMVLLSAVCVFSQDSPSAAKSPVASRPAVLVSPPVDLKPDASGAVPPEQIRELLRRAEEKDIENDKQQRDYTYIERQEDHKLDGHGAVKKIESRTSEVLEIYGEPVSRLTAKDDKPLPADEAKKEDEKIQKIIDNLLNLFVFLFRLVGRQGFVILGSQPRDRFPVDFKNLRSPRFDLLDRSMTVEFVVLLTLDVGVIALLLVVLNVLLFGTAQ